MDYLTYGGLTREVWLTVCDSIRIEDVFVYSRLSEEALSTAGTFTADAELIAEVSVKNGKDDMMLRQSIREKGTEAYALLGEQALAGDTTKLCFLLKAAKLWDTEHPVLYEVKTELLQGESILDELVTVVGIRRTEFKADGFYINGKKRKLRGLNRHQSFPYVGYAMPESMQRFDAEILKKPDTMQQSEETEEG